MRGLTGSQVSQIDAAIKYGQRTYGAVYPGSLRDAVIAAVTRIVEAEREAIRAELTNGASS